MATQDKKKSQIKTSILNTAKKFSDSGTKFSTAFQTKISDLSKGNFANQYKQLLISLSNSKKLDMPTKEEFFLYYSSTYESLKGRKNKTFNQAFIFVNTILASDFSRNMSKWLEGLFEGVPTKYDKALDATYNATNIGGGKLHRLLDDSHTIWDAWDKSKDALPDDSFTQEVLGCTLALIKDLTTEVGLPMFDMTKENYNSLANALSDNFNIPKDWFSDILCVNGVEVIGSSIGVLSVALSWNKKDVKQFSTIASSLGISTIASANPLLAIITLVSLAKSFSDAKKKNTYSDFINGLAKGGFGTGLFLATATVIGGPAWVGVVTGTVVAVCIHKTMDKIEFVEIATFVQAAIKNGLQRNNILIGIEQSSTA